MKEKIHAFIQTLKTWKSQVDAAWRDREIIKADLQVIRSAFPIASKVVKDLNESQFFGATRTQIAMQRVKYELNLKGIKDDDLVALVFIVISLVYLYETRGIANPLPILRHDN